MVNTEIRDDKTVALSYLTPPLIMVPVLRSAKAKISPRVAVARNEFEKARMLSLLHAASPKQVLIDYNTILEIHRIKIMVYMKEIIRSYGGKNKWDLENASGNLPLIGKLKQILGFVVNGFAIARPTNRAGLYKSITLSDWVAGYNSFIVGPHNPRRPNHLPIRTLIAHSIHPHRKR